MTPSRRDLSLGMLLLPAANVLVSGDTFADDGRGDPFERIAAARTRIKTLQGPFAQTRTVGLLATDVRSQGRVVLVRPDRLRWELFAPDDVTFWIVPEGLAYRSPHGSGRLATPGARVESQLDDLKALLGGSLTKLRERWDLQVVKDDAAGAELKATPRPGVAVHMKEIRLTLAPDLARPTRVVLAEGPHDRSVIEFGTLVLNAPVDDAVMRPPA